MNRWALGLGAGLLLFTWLMFGSLARANEETAAIDADPVELKVFNRSIFVFHATLLGEVPEVRAMRAEAIINEILQSHDHVEIRVEPIQDSYLVLMGDRRAFFIAPKDLSSSSASVHEAANEVAQRLRQVVAESSEAQNVQYLLMAAGFSALATLAYIVALRLLRRGRERAQGWLPKRMQKHTRKLKVGDTQLLDLTNAFPLARGMLALGYWTLFIASTYEWLSFVLRRFPYTRPWGESLNQYMIDLLRYLLDACVEAIPGMAIALAIFFIARGFSAFAKRLLERISRPGTISWLTRETLLPTTRLASLAIWLFALAMAYPYLPGAETEAFKGVTVLVGLMVSLGATSVVGQAAAGLILTYTRTLRPGEYVRIGEHEGTITELGIFTTSIRTGLGEVLTIPNSMITGSVTKNYSRVVDGPGYIVDTVVTIGYDTPWRQVTAMLTEAANRTPGILSMPPPQVFQTALSDFYPEYRLVAQAVPSQPLSRAELLSLLHANIQDVFNEYGVQIMSPHYLADPEQEKLVAKGNWYAAPAQQPLPKEKNDKNKGEEKRQ